MYSLILMAMLLADGPTYHIKNTELFQVMDFHEVHVAPNGEVYVLNFNEARVQHYGVDGKLKQNIGRRGKGPGEFTFPTSLEVVDQHIYIFDYLTALMSVFDMNGKFIKQITLPGRNVTVVRGKKGWLFYKASDDSSNLASELQWAGPDFNTPKFLAKIDSTGRGKGTWARSDGGKTEISYSPLSVVPLLVGGPDGKRLYYGDRTAFKIDVYDGSTGALLYKISSDEKRIPFDTEWADEQYKTATEGTRKQNPGVPIEKIYPEFFPAIRELLFDPDGNLVVDRWRGRPDDKHNLTAYDAKGKEMASKYSYEVLRRFAGQAQGMAYVIMFEEEDDAGIVKVPMKELSDFVAKYPITDWSQSRSISISD